MEHYCKGKNIEEPIEMKKLPFKDLPDDFLWMQVQGGSKIRNLLTYALKEFPQCKYVVWTGYGQSVGKTISCAELMKRNLNNKLNQINKICYRLVEEYWDPLLSGLDPIVVKRKLPMIHILLSTESLDTNELGYQAPGSNLTYNNDNETKAHVPTKRKDKVKRSNGKQQ